MRPALGPSCAGPDIGDLADVLQRSRRPELSTWGVVRTPGTREEPWTHPSSDPKISLHSSYSPGSSFGSSGEAAQVVARPRDRPDRTRRDCCARRPQQACPDHLDRSAADAQPDGGSAHPVARAFTVRLWIDQTGTMTRQGRWLTALWLVGVGLHVSIDRVEASGGPQHDDRVLRRCDSEGAVGSAQRASTLDPTRPGHAPVRLREAAQMQRRPS